MRSKNTNFIQITFVEPDGQRRVVGSLSQEMIGDLKPILREFWGALLVPFSLLSSSEVTAAKATVMNLWGLRDPLSTWLKLGVFDAISPIYNLDRAAIELRLMEAARLLGSNANKVVLPFTSADHCRDTLEQVIDLISDISPDTLNSQVQVIRGYSLPDRAEGCFRR